MTTGEITGTIHAERRGLVTRLRAVRDDEWGRPSLCAGWTVGDVLGHLTTPFLVSRREMGATLRRTRSISAAMDEHARAIAAGHEPAELIAILDANAGGHFRPPGMPFTAPLTDVIAHGADIRWALGDAHDDWGRPERLVPVLAFLLTFRARFGFVDPARARGVRLEATDVDWSHGDGPRVHGPALSLALALLGRRAALADLGGDGHLAGL